VRTHGKYSTYNKGCRCSECKTANNLHHSAARERRKNRNPRRHGAMAYSNWGCRCQICCDAWSEKMRRDRERRFREVQSGDREIPHGRNGYSWGCRCAVCRKETFCYQNSKLRERNDLARRRAGRHHYQWTGPELEVASREDLTMAEIATLLGRTIYAVRHKRRALRIDPRAINLAGIPTDSPGTGVQVQVTERGSNA